jgi:hypothetical protein
VNSILPDHNPSRPVVVVVDGSVAGGSVVVVGGVVVVVVGGLIGAVVVVVVAAGFVVGVAAGFVVGVAAGFVVVAAGFVVVVGERVVGVVVGLGKMTEAGSVEIFDDLALDGTFRLGDFPVELVVELVVVGPAAGSPVVVVLVAGVVGGDFAEISPTVWPWTSSGLSSWCTTTNKAATAKATVVPQLHCSNRR